MEYLVNLTQNVLKKDLPKLQRAGFDLSAVYKSLEKLESNPYITSRAKTGNLQGYRALDFKRGYRLVFEIDEEEKTVTVVSIDSHDEAYRKAKKRK